MSPLRKITVKAEHPRPEALPVVVDVAWLGQTMTQKDGGITFGRMHQAVEVML